MSLLHISHHSGHMKNSRYSCCGDYIVLSTDYFSYDLSLQETQRPVLLLGTNRAKDFEKRVGALDTSSIQVIFHSSASTIEKFL